MSLPTALADRWAQAFGEFRPGRLRVKKVTGSVGTLPISTPDRLYEMFTFVSTLAAVRVLEVSGSVGAVPNNMSVWDRWASAFVMIDGIPALRALFVTGAATAHAAEAEPDRMAAMFATVDGNVALRVWVDAGVDPYRDMIMKRNPVAYFRLDETSGTNAADQVGAVTDMTYTNGVLLNQPGLVPGHANACASFDGIDDFCTSASAALRIAGDLTLECWINQGRRGDQAGGADNILVRCGISGTDRLYMLSVTLLGAVVFGHHDSGGTVRSIITGNNVIAVNVGYHVAATRSNGTSLSIYVNGVKTSGTVAAAPQAAGTQTTRLGATGATSGETQGRIDEVAIYNRVLGDDAIRLSARGVPINLSLSRWNIVTVGGLPALRVSEV